MIKKKSNKVIWIIGLSLLVVGILSWILYNTRVQMWNDSAVFEQQCSEYIVSDIPDEINDFCAVGKNGLFTKYYLYSFVLNEESYKLYQEDVLKKYSVDLSDEEQLKYGYEHWYGMKFCKWTMTDLIMSWMASHLNCLLK